MDRAKKGKQGEYLSMYVMAFSIAHVFGHNVGLRLVDHYGYNTTWSIMVALGLVGALLLVYLRKILTTKNELI
jgi:predicted MFS family arabinose efflux permease